jgi:DNA-binding NarL/FixJ family response regulator
MDKDDHVNSEFESWMHLMQQVKINTQVSDYLDSASASLEILTANRVAAFIYDYAFGNYSYMNEYFVELMGKTREEILSSGVKIMQELAHPDDFLKCLNLVKKSILEFSKMKEKEREAFLFRFFFRLRKAENEYIWVMQSNRHSVNPKDGSPIMVAFLLELFNLQYPMKVMGILETPNRSMEIHPDGEMDLLKLLSQRELEILQLIRQGLSTPEISKKLMITVSTVKVHRQNVFKKLKVSNMVQAIDFLIKVS